MGGASYVSATTSKWGRSNNEVRGRARPALPRRDKGGHYGTAPDLGCHLCYGFTRITHIPQIAP
jgi:hypothetical protein